MTEKKPHAMLEAQRGTRAGVLEGMAKMRSPGVRIPLRERADLAKAAFALHERGRSTWQIAVELAVSEPTAINLVGYGRRLAAGQPEQLAWR